MIAAGEFDDELSTGKPAREADARHRCFGATIYHPDLLNRGYPMADQFGHFYLCRVWNSEAETLRGCCLNSLHYLFRSVAQDRWAPGPHIVDIFVSFDIPNV